MSQTPLTTWRSDIDGLRALAVLSVILFHAYPQKIPGGFIGVDIFFIISGYLITEIIITNIKENSFSFGDFYFRRIRRIFPALLATLLFVLITGWLTLLTDEFKQLSKHILGGASFVSNFILMNESGYFDSSAETKPLLHLWSLGIEEQFYIFWPLVIWLTYRLKRSLLITIATILSLSFISNLLFSQSATIFTFYSPLTRSWELLIGSIIAYFVTHDSKGIKHLSALSNLMSFAGLSLLLLMFFFYKKDWIYPSWWALVPTTGAALLIISPNSLTNRYLLSNRFMVLIGAISFPLYLWHWPLLSYARIFEGSEIPSHARFKILLLSIFLAYLTYRFIEKPIRTKIHSFTQLTPVLASMVLTAMVGFYGLFISPGVPHRAFPTHTNPEIVKAINDWDYPGKLHEFNYEGQHQAFTNSAQAPEVLLIGDSHIEQFAPKFTANSNMPPAVFLTTSGRPPLKEMCNHDGAECGSALDAGIELLQHVPSIKTVVVGFCWNCYFVDDVQTDRGRFFIDQQHSMHLFYQGDGASLALLALKNRLKNLAHTYKVVLVLDNPSSELFNPKHMISATSSGNRLSLLQEDFKPIDFTEIRVPLQPSQRNLNNLLTTMGNELNITVIDQLSALCPNDLCRTSFEGKPIYLDDGHLRPFFAIEGTPYFNIP